MGTPALRMPCYLVEWYRPDLIEDQFGAALASLGNCMTSMIAEGMPVRLLMTVTVPSDEVVFGVIAANSEDVVAQLCNRAGVPAERVTAAIDTRLAHRND
jgi:hypothetical protein